MKKLSYQMPSQNRTIQRCPEHVRAAVSRATRGQKMREPVVVMRRYGSGVRPVSAEENAATELPPKVEVEGNEVDESGTTES